MDLAGLGLGQGVGEFDLAGILMPPQGRLHQVSDFVGEASRTVGSRLHHDERFDDLAPQRIQLADHRSFRDGLVSEIRVFQQDTHLLLATLDPA